MVTIDDLRQEAWMGLLKACESYDPNRSNKFITFAYVYIRGYVLRFIFKAKKDKPYRTCEDPEELEHNSYEDHSAEHNDLVLAITKAASDQKHAYLLEEYFMKGKSLRQIAKEMNISHGLVSIRLNKLLTVLQLRLNNENIKSN